MKIAIIQPRTSYHLAGSEKVSLKHAEHLSKLGNEILLYTLFPFENKESFLFEEFKAKKINNVVIKQFKIPEKYLYLFAEANSNNHERWMAESIMFNELIYQDLLTEKPDIIFAYYLPDNQSKPLGIPNVVYLAGYPSQKVEIYSSFIKACDATISISNVVKEKWSDEIKDIKQNYLLSTGVDYPLSFNENIKPKAPVNLVFAGRLIERKGPEILIDAFAEIIKKNHDIHLWLLGTGPLESILKEKVRSFGLAENVTFTGLVSNPNDYFKMADVCIFPSFEGDGLMGVVLESMAAGKPVICTSNNGNEDVITNNVNGIIIPSRNKEFLVHEIVRLINNKELRQDLGKKAQVFIQQNIAWENNVNKLEAIFKEIQNNVSLGGTK